MSRHQIPSISLNPQSCFSVANLSMLPADLSSYKKHFTATAVVMEQSHILLVHHRRIGAWLPPGGHIEDYELPHETAIRETKEETGIDILPLNLDGLPVGAGVSPPTSTGDAFFLPASLCVHAIKAREKNSDYYHIDFVYLCVPADSCANKDISLPAVIASEEVYDARWIKLEDLSHFPLANNVVEIVALAKSRLNLT